MYDHQAPAVESSHDGVLGPPADTAAGHGITRAPDPGLPQSPMSARTSLASVGPVCRDRPIRYVRGECVVGVSDCWRPPQLVRVFAGAGCGVEEPEPRTVPAVKVTRFGLALPDPLVYHL